ncbi:hypothetical protein D3C80_1229510 [compost metagenome]
MQAPRHLHLRNSQLYGNLVEQFLKRAEWAEPAAEGATSPEQQTGGDGGPQDEDQGRRQEEFPPEGRDKRIDECQDIDHGKLSVGIPAEPDQRKDEIAGPDPGKQFRPLHQPVLEEKDSGEHEKGGHSDGHRHAVHVPDADP